jgi:hypothetical protein
VGADTDELKHTFTGLAVDENEIGLDVAITVVGPLTGECVVSVGSGQRGVGAQELDQAVKLVREEFPVLASGFALQIALEAGGKLNPPHQAQP